MRTVFIAASVAHSRKTEPVVALFSSRGCSFPHGMIEGFMFAACDGLQAQASTIGCPFLEPQCRTDFTDIGLPGVRKNCSVLIRWQSVCFSVLMLVLWAVFAAFASACFASVNRERPHLWPTRTAVMPKPELC
jgi:hypothetical protein